MSRLAIDRVRIDPQSDSILAEKGPVIATIVITGSISKSAHTALAFRDIWTCRCYSRVSE